ncbi:polymorphic toxin-type HINT domain-containing protein [Streptomyces formicae]
MRCRGLGRVRGGCARKTRPKGAIGNLVGHLAKVTEPGEKGKDKVTEYVYDTEGNRLIGRTPTETTLYLGHTEVTLAKGADKAKATRYTPLGGGHQAVKADDGTITFTTADHQGTGQLSVAAADMKLAQRRTLPFGGPRGETPKSWPGTKGFVGGTDDTKSTGLTHLGAREYDPSTGRFLSVDPVMDLTDPQQINGYTYGNNNPVTFSDPTGRLFGCIACAVMNVYKAVKSILHKAVSANRGGGRGGSGSANRGGYSSRGYSGGGHTSSAVFRGSGSKSMSRTSYGIDSAFGVLNHGIFRPLNDFFSGGGAAEVAKDFVLPDLHSWEECGKHPGVSVACGSAAMDLPMGKWLKPFKGVVKDLKKAEGGGEAAGKTKKGVPSNCKCFLAGTGVLMADGSSKNIEDVELGDKVLATDPETGETRESEVTATIVTDDDKQFTELTIATPEGSEKLTATYGHPFWSVDKKDWVEAGDLKSGMTLRTDEGRTVTVTAARQYQGHSRTYNLTVEGLHTYYVLAGETPVLVHNSDCDLPKGHTSSPALKGDPYHPDSVASRSAESGKLYAGSVGDRAGGLGYKSRIPAQKAPFDSHGQVVFSNGKNYITPDVDGHNVTGGWKMFNRRGQRIGTYDPDLNYLKE